MGKLLKENDIIAFIKQKDYVYIREIGKGGFGRAVLLKDLSIDEEFVCKKYEPYYPEMAKDFYKNFVKEIKLMHKLFHPNIVRIFNYHLYEEISSGYIIMEHIDGSSIDKYLANYPEKINDIFKQLITGFKYLEDAGVAHRDIRPLNILVNTEGIVKIIDFGFGKEIKSSEINRQKSISLNWYYDVPNEFFENTYDIQTDIYFVGKLIEQMINENNISIFRYSKILDQMIPKDPSVRIGSFSKISQLLSEVENNNIEFSSEEKNTYQSFSKSLIETIEEISSTSTYNSDINNILHELDILYQNTMLNDELPHSPNLISIFLNGQYRYNNYSKISLEVINNFSKVFSRFPKEKKNIVLNNLFSRLDGIKRYDIDDGFPF